MSNNEVKFIGSVRVNKSGLKTRAVFGGIAHSGWFLQVRDEEGHHMIAVQMKTLDSTVADQLEANGSEFDLTVNGYIKSENWAPKDAPSNWVTVFYATEVVEATASAVASEPSF